jgi:multimeric flavodoxin WrbA
VSTDIEGGEIMKKVTAIIGTQTKKATYRAVQEFEKDLKQYGEIDFDYVFLSDYNLEFCRGCKVCFDKGEEFCPLKDDRDLLLEKLEQSNGVIFATPNYAFQLSARMKNFLDRLAFIDHRPRFFGKPCTVIVTQGIGKGGSILKYLKFSAETMGFQVSKGCCVTTLEPMTEKRQQQLVQKVKKVAIRFNDKLRRPVPAPSMFRLMMFRIARNLIKGIGEDYRDFHYYRDKGWLESDYYYNAPLGFPKKAVGYLFDLLGRRLAKQQS